MNYSLMHFLEYLLFSNTHFVVTSARRTPVTIPLLEMIHDYSDHVSPFDQLIIYPSFIHISFGPRSRRQVIDER